MKAMKEIVNAGVYIDEILTRKVKQSAIDNLWQNPSGTPAEFIFQQESAPCHTARVCQAWFRDNNARLHGWPGNSPDLNRIQNVCSVEGACFTGISKQQN